MKKIMWALPVFALSLSPMAHAKLGQHGTVATKATSVNDLSTDQLNNFAENNGCFPPGTSRQNFINGKIKESKDGLGTDNVAGAQGDGSWNDFVTNFTSAINEMPTCTADVMQNFTNEANQSAQLTDEVKADRAAVADASDPTTLSAAQAKLTSDRAQLTDVNNKINAQISTAPDSGDND